MVNVLFLLVFCKYGELLISKIDICFKSHKFRLAVNF